MKMLIVSLTLIALAGCTEIPARMASAGAPAAELPAASLSEAALRESLFKDDTSVMSNEEMDKILSARLRLPTGARLAVVRFGQLPRWRGWSEDFVRTSDRLDADFLARLGSSKRVASAAYLPSLVMPTLVTVPHLRKAAVRCQADLMLIYTTASRTYEKEKFLGRDETRAYCTVEALLIDTRTGIIPFSATVTETFSARRSDQDMEFSETIARAEQQAIGKAWLRLADQTVAYLDALPRE